MNLVRNKYAEWLDNEVAQVVREALKRKLEQTYQERAELMYPGDAHRTQEERMLCLGTERTLRDFLDLLELNKDTMEEYFTLMGIPVLRTEKEVELEKDEE